MMINICYFSGTGNTAWVVEQLAGRLTELGDEVRCCWLIGLAQRPPAESTEPWMSRRLFAGEACTHCGRCAEHCPVGGIEIVGEEVRFTDACILCMRCYHQCPRQAIQWTRLSRNQAIFRRYRGPDQEVS